MLELDTVRGPHSTGIFCINIDNKIEYDKTVGTPWDFFKESEVFSKNKNLTGLYKVMVGHNRFATFGAINKENAHPFDFVNVIGVHNGTIATSSFKFLEEKGVKSVVDSQMLYGAINNIGLKETIKNTSGAWSLVYWDKDAKVLNLLKNDQRPMWYTFSNNKKTLLFASEPWILKVGADYAGLEVTKCQSTKIDKQYFLKLEGETFKQSAEDFKYFSASVEGKVPDTTSNTVYSFSNEGYFKSREDAFKASEEDGNIPAFFNKEVDKFNIYPNFAYFTLSCLLSEYQVKVYIPRDTNIEDIRTKFEKTEGWFYLKHCGYVNGPHGESGMFTASLNDISENKPWDEYEMDIKTQEDGAVINGKVYTEEEFDKLMNIGCCNCGDTTTPFKYHDKIKWLKPVETFLCPDCVDQENTFGTYVGNY